MLLSLAQFMKLFCQGLLVLSSDVGDNDTMRSSILMTAGDSHLVVSSRCFKVGEVDVSVSFHCAHFTAQLMLLGRGRICV